MKSIGSRATVQRIRSRLLSERGNVESALTLIPLLILFLTVGQVCLSVYSRNINDEEVQGAVAYAAMGSTPVSASGRNGSSSLTPSWSSPLIALPLPGGGSLLVGERQLHGLSITPLLPGGDSYTTTGVAVQE